MEVVVAPVLHKYVPPPDAVRSAEGDAHVMVAEGGVTAALGGVVFPVTADEADAVHPFAPVTVTYKYLRCSLKWKWSLHPCSTNMFPRLMR